MKEAPQTIAIVRLSALGDLLHALPAGFDLRSLFPRARILWIACAAPGSLSPAVPIALELTRRGHELTVLCAPSSQKTFESLGLVRVPGRHASWRATCAPSSRSGVRAWTR